jgi:Mn-dependent DtxR family transcriptional regulator
MEASLTKSERETLKAIYRLTNRGPGDATEEGAHTGALAEALKLSPGTVTATV